MKGPHIFLVLLCSVLLVCLIFGLRRTQKQKQKKNRTRRHVEGFVSDFDEVLDNYCSKIDDDADDYVGKWDNESKPFCAKSTCQIEECHGLVDAGIKYGVESGVVYEYIAKSSPMRMETTANGAGECKTKENLSQNIYCSVDPPTSKLPNNIIAYRFDTEIERWVPVECNYYFNNRGQKILRNVDNLLEVVNVYSLVDGTENLIEGDVSAPNKLYDTAGPSCTLVDNGGDWITDDKGNNVFQKTQSIKTIDSDMNALSCLNDSYRKYGHIDYAGFQCGFEEDECETCPNQKSECYAFNEPERKWDTVHYLSTMYDDTCGTYKVISDRNSDFQGMNVDDFGSMSDADKNMYLLQSDGLVHEKNAGSCEVNIPEPVCNHSRVHTCKFLNNDTMAFDNVVYKQQNKEGGTSGCEYCVVGVNDDSILTGEGKSCVLGTAANVDKYAQLSDNMIKGTDACPVNACPVGKQMVMNTDNLSEPLRCEDCGDTEYYDNATNDCKLLSMCGAGEYVKDVNVNYIKNGNTERTTAHDYFNNIQPAGGSVLLTDIQCEKCPGNTKMTKLSHRDLGCSGCEEGEQSSMGSSACTLCEDGKYRSTGMGSCDFCPNPGEVPNADLNGCYNCFQDDLVPDGDRTTCVSCVTGQVFDTNGCRDECNSNEHFNGTSCVPVDGGKYVKENADGSISIEDCSRHHYRTSEMNKSGCSPCGSKLTTTKHGLYSSVGSSGCEECDIDNNEYWREWEEGGIWRGECTQCNGIVSTDADGRRTVCSGCGMVNIRINTSTGATEPEQVRKIAANGDCVCPIGTHSSGTECVKCDNVHAWDGLSCVKCDPGKVRYIAADGSESCENCDEHQYRREEDMECKPCSDFETPGDDGKFYSKPGCSECTKCPQNSYWDVTSGCTTCPDGNTGAQGIGISSCDPCPAHNYRSHEMVDCMDCSPGYAYGTGNSACTNCPNGQYFDKTAGSGTCVEMTCNFLLGEYFDNSTSQCSGSTRCTGDQVVNMEKTGCIDCPENSSPDLTDRRRCVCNDPSAVWDYENNRCTTCPKGNEFKDGACSPCPGGTNAYVEDNTCNVCGANAVPNTMKTDCDCDPSMDNLFKVSDTASNRKSCVQCDPKLGKVFDDFNVCSDCDETQYVNSDGACAFCPNEGEIPKADDRTQCVCNPDEHYKRSTTGDCVRCDTNIAGTTWNAATGCHYETCDGVGYYSGNDCIECGDGSKPDSPTNATSCVCDVPSDDGNTYSTHYKQDATTDSFDDGCIKCNTTDEYYHNDTDNCVPCKTTDDSGNPVLNRRWNHTTKECVHCQGNTVLKTDEQGDPYCDTCLTGTIPNSTHTECVCNTALHYKSHSTLATGCSAEPCNTSSGTNKYWNTVTNECVTCGLKSHVNGNECDCDPPANGKEIGFLDENDRKLGCIECNISRGSSIDNSTTPATCTPECVNSETQYYNAIGDECVVCPSGSVVNYDAPGMTNPNGCKCPTDVTGNANLESTYVEGTGCVSCDTTATPNQYLNGNSCSTCGANKKYNKDTNQCECDNTPPNHYYTDGDGACVRCPPTNAGGTPQYFDGENCTPCGANQKVNSGKNGCECIVGFVQRADDGVCVANDPSFCADKNTTGSASCYIRVGDQCDELVNSTYNGTNCVCNDGYGWNGSECSPCSNATTVDGLCETCTGSPETAYIVNNTCTPCNGANCGRSGPGENCGFVNTAGDGCVTCFVSDNMRRSQTGGVYSCECKPNDKIANKYYVMKSDKSGCVVCSDENMELNASNQCVCNSGYVQMREGRVDRCVPTTGYVVKDDFRKQGYAGFIEDSALSGHSISSVFNIFVDKARTQT